ncbi:MAG: DUF4388 domain-containing protein [Thermoanaerobaculia bacterium]
MTPLIEGAPEVLAVQLEDWVRQTSRTLRSSQTVPALIFYAAHKLELLGELGLLPWDDVQKALDGVKGRLMRLCPLELQSQLRLDLGRLGSHRARHVPAKAAGSKSEHAPRLGVAKPIAAAEETPLEGSLRVLSLPDLLATMETSGTAGLLRILDERGQVLGSIWLRAGRFLGCRHGDLGGTQAFWRLLDDPRATSFRLSQAGAEEPPSDAEEHQLRALLLEGARRSDELKFARGLVPDDATMRATGIRPTPGPEEDGAFVRELWIAVSGGATPARCEASTGADSYRVRSLLIHWLREGSLEIEYRPTLGSR